MTATKSPKEYVVLVDQNNQEIGSADKLAAHQNNLLHRAFSIFIFRTQFNQHEILLQQRAFTKYHSPGLWTNTCCSHPRPQEELIKAGKRRLQEEMGIITELKDLGWFIYNTQFDNGLSEHEADHVLIGNIPWNETFHPNPTEVVNTRWVSLEALDEELRQSPHQFTAWFAQALEPVRHFIKSRQA